MKFMMMVLMCVFSLSAMAQDCKHIAERSKENFLQGDNEDGSNPQLYLGVGGWIAGAGTAAVIGISVPAALLTGGVALIAAPATYLLINNGKRNRYIRLVDQAEAFASAEGSTIPGKLLVKAHKKINKNAETKISLLTVAKFLVKGNRSGSFCPGGKFTPVRKLMNSLPDTDVSLIQI